MHRTLIDPIGYPDKACASADIKNINFRLPRSSTMAGTEALAGAISEGHSWCPSLFSQLNRQGEFWLSISWLFADVDKNSPSMNKLYKRANKVGLPLPSILHESFSSTERKRKWRVIYLLEKPITNKYDAYKALIAIGEIFKADMPVQEPTRLLYGTTKFHICECNATLLSNSHVEQLLLAKTTRKPPAIHLAKPITETEAVDFDFNALSKHERKIVLFAMKDVSELMANPYATREGYEGNSRYEALWTSARKLGQLRCVPLQCAINWLTKEIEAKPMLWADWDKEPIKIIEDGVRWGRQHARI